MDTSTSISPTSQIPQNVEVGEVSRLLLRHSSAILVLIPSPFWVWTERIHPIRSIFPWGYGWDPPAQPTLLPRQGRILGIPGGTDA